MLRRNHQKSPTRGPHCWGLPLGLALLMVGEPALAQTMPELSVGFLGRLRSTVDVGAEQLALVTVEFAAPNGAAATASSVAFTDTDPELETAPGTEVPLDSLERDESAAPSAPRRLRAGPTKEAAMAQQVPYVLTSTFVRQAVDAALAAQGIAAAFGRLDSLASRARTSAMLPDTRLRAGRDRDQSLRLTPTDAEPYRYTQSGGVSFVVEAAVTWRLGRLLFASEELSVERLRLAQTRERQRVTQSTMSELLAWQTAWRRAKIAGDGPSHAAEELFESTLRLDLLTDGWFSAHQPAPGPAASAQRTSTGEQESEARPATETKDLPVRAPRLLDQRLLPRQAQQAAGPAVAAGPSAREDLERMALSR